MKRTVKKYLDEIAEHLWNNSASLFVGAGFSRNAISRQNVHSMPLWTDLGDMFFAKVNGRKPNASNKSYANVLKLAEDVEHMYGRMALGTIVSEAISDKDRYPSEVYSEMLSLPWFNVYTTNYDTLLERSADFLEKSGGRSYSKVLKGEDLPLQVNPCIVKLHGDINDLTSIIITEEDYRLYPSKHSLLVNDVCHTFVHNTMVMIGFSGEDPNFNQWLGWVKDNLGVYAKKVYLISVAKMPEARIETLAYKNVTVVDINGLAGRPANATEDISAFLRYLDEYRPQLPTDESSFSKNVLAWGRDGDSLILDFGSDYMKVYKVLKDQRDSYPGWLVLPREKREYWTRTKSFTLSGESLSSLKKPFDLLYLEQFNWLLEKCLFPIYNEWESIYLSVLGKYDHDDATSDNAIKNAWINLKVALLRLYRQEAWDDKWHNLQTELSGCLSMMDEDQYASYMYEVCLYHVYKCDYVQLETDLSCWKKNLELPYWEVKKASLLAEFISLDLGKALAKEAFKVIADKFDTCTYKKRYYWASRKAYAHTILNMMCSADFSRDYEQERQKARETWNELRKYSDIRYESEFFDTKLQWAEDVFNIKKGNAKYELGRHSFTSPMNGRDRGEYRITYAFFSYYESLGYPVHLPRLLTLKKDSLAKAVSLMSYCSPAIAENWVQRFGELSVVEAMFNRKRLDRMSEKQVTSEYEKYLSYLENLVSIEECEIKNWQQTLKLVSLRILSRLCLKASYELRVKTFGVLDRIFLFHEGLPYQDVNFFVKMLMASFSSEEKCALLPKLIKLNVMTQQMKGSDEYLAELMLYMPEHLIGAKPIVDSVIVDQMIDAVALNEAKRKAYIIRLVVLYRYGLLNDRQIERFADALWKVTDSYGFPSGSIYSKFAFLTLPCPCEVDPKSLLRQYFASNTLPFNKSKKSIAFFVNLQLINEIIGATNMGINYCWSNDELERLIDQISVAWSNDKDLILSDETTFGISAKDEYSSRFIDIGKIMIRVIAPNIDKVNQESSLKLKDVIDEYAEYGLPCFSIKKAFPQWYCTKDLDENIIGLASSNDEKKYADFLSGIIKSVRSGNNISDAVEIVSDNFRCNRKVGLGNTIDVLGFIAQRYYGVLSSRSIQNILLGLDVLFRNTVIDNTDSELEANRKLYLRQETAELVKSMLKADMDKSNKILLNWQSYYEDRDTFLDVRSAYADA